ncbi:MAG TPA: nucleotidyltransferase domain-containing protein [Thermoanaerobaculia bacterium]|nr:nucleotidyltransferase domain-containing protein [Thermoanaerobaculia bacterium]
MESWIVRLRERRPEIEQAIWFGSWVHGTPTPGSDVDICLILASSTKSYRERIDDFAPDGLAIAVEVFPYTRAELESLALEQPGWFREIMRGRTIPPR